MGTAEAYEWPGWATVFEQDPGRPGAHRCLAAPPKSLLHCSRRKTNLIRRQVVTVRTERVGAHNCPLQRGRGRARAWFQSLTARSFASRLGIELRTRFGAVCRCRRSTTGWRAVSIP